MRSVPNCTARSSGASTSEVRATTLSSACSTATERSAATATAPHAIAPGRGERRACSQKKKPAPHLLGAEGELADQLLQQQGGLGVRDAARRP